MQHRIVLDVRMMANHDAVDVAAQNDVVPNARMVADLHVAKNDGGLSEVNAPAESWFLPEEGVQLFFQFTHGLVVPIRRGLKNKKPPRISSGRVLTNPV